MSNIYIGRYIAKESLIHKVNPLAKLLSIVIIIGAVAVAKSYYAIALSSFIFVLILFISNITLKEIYLTVKPFIFLLLLTFIIQLLFSKDGSFSLDLKNNLANSIVVVTQFFLIIALSSIFTLTTSQVDIVRSILFFVRPFRKFVNINEIAISIIIAIRFIPLLFHEADTIIVAQKIRGIWVKGYKNIFKNASIFFKAESFIIPLFVKVIDYAEKISITLKYKNNLDKIMIVEKLKVLDYITIAIAICIAVGIHNV